MKFRAFALIAALSGLLIAQIAALPLAQAEAADPKKIGVVLPLSGGVAPIGESLKNGMLMAQAELDPQKRTEFLFDDDGFQPGKTVAALRRFLDVEKVSGLFVFGTGQGFASNQIAEQAKTPLVVIGIDPKVSDGKSYVIRFFPTIETIHTAMMNEVKRRGYKSIALVTTSVDSTLALKAKFEADAPELIVYSDSFLPDVRDFSTTVSKIKDLKPDAVGMLLMPPQVSAVARQLKEKHFKGALFGAHPTENQAEFKAAQGGLDESWFVSAAVTADPAFFARYSKRHPKTPEHYASMGYDLGKLFIEGNASAEGLNTHLHTVKSFKGAIGTYSAGSNNDFELPVEIRTGKEAIARWAKEIE